jgi:hypothetical protein
MIIEQKKIRDPSSIINITHKPCIHQRNARNPKFPTLLTILHRHLLTTIRPRKRRRTQRITIHTRRRENPILLSRKLKSPLLRIRRIKTISTIPSSASAEVIAGGSGDAGCCDCAFVEEWVRVTGFAGAGWWCLYFVAGCIAGGGWEAV